jgi:deoxyribodipyrimidine photolyase
MRSTSLPAIWWIRRDFRLYDNPALCAAVDGGGLVMPLFVLDPVLRRSPGEGRGPWLQAALAALDADIRRDGGLGLSILDGKPSQVIPTIARQVGAERVHISADFAPHGRRRDAAVRSALMKVGIELSDGISVRCRPRDAVQRGRPAIPGLLALSRCLAGSWRALPCTSSCGRLHRLDRRRWPAASRAARC